MTSRLGAGLDRLASRLSRRTPPADAVTLTALVALALGLGLLSVVESRFVPDGALTVVLIVAGYFLRVRSLLLFIVVLFAVTIYVEVLTPGRFRAEGLAVLTVAALVVGIFARSRARLGVLGTTGESMFVDLRDRLRAQGRFPPLPAGWEAEVIIKSANGASFAGDFVVANRSPDGRTLEIALVDVSGKGQAAGTRALLLSGAFGALLGAMPQQQFLPAANHYLVSQRWEEGFATAAHLVVDLMTGAYVVTSAGHPPAAQFHSGSGRWEVADRVENALLGIIEDAEYVGEKGMLHRGDAMLLYTDGLVEIPGRDLSVGIDKLVGEAERLVTAGFRHGARRLVESGTGGEGDDRGLVLLWRT